MSDYYVSGCKGQDDDIVTCENSEAEFWTLYLRDSMGLSQGIVDFTFREDAEAAMKVYAERDALQQKLNAMAAENVALKACAQFYADSFINFPVLNGPSHMPANALLNDCGGTARQALSQSPATDAILSELRAEGIDLLASEAGRMAQLFKQGSADWKRWKSIVFFAVNFAAYLRNGGHVAKDGE